VGDDAAGLVLLRHPAERVVDEFERVLRRGGLQR
jgi:hypothetical protein